MGEESVLALEKILEVEGIADADCRSVEAVAPCDPVAVADEGDARVILVVGIDHFGISGLELYRLVIYLPVDTVGAESGEDIHLDCLVVAAEHSGKAVFERYYRAIENTVGGRNVISAYDRVAAEAPHYVGASCRTLFPGYLLSFHIVSN